jgi:hypothetical protein
VPVAGLIAPAASFAQALSDPEAVAKAKQLFAQGSALYLAGEYGKALDALTTSYRLLPSPNSELVIARCLRELGRLVEAQSSFASAEVEARRRAAQGAPKYTQTADSAAAEGAAVRSGLGTIHVRVEGVDPDTKLEVDGVPTDLPPGGEVTVWHVPGEVTVSLRSPSGLEQKQVATVRAGAEVTTGFSRPEPPAPPEPIPAPPPAAVVPAPPLPAPAHTDRPAGAAAAPGAGWAKPAAFVSGTVALAGAGLFTGFGLAADQTYRTLKARCGATGCTPSDRHQADVGSRQQLIANVSLVAGSVAAAATITFIVIAASHPAQPNASSRLRWHLLVAATALGVAGEFQ